MEFYTGSSIWQPGMVNGHSNSTLGGNRSNAKNIFDARRGQAYPANYGMGQQMRVGASVNLYGGYQYYGPCAYTGSCCQVLNCGWYEGVNPPYVGTCSGYDGDYVTWYTDGGIGGAKGKDSMAHKFTCSKCHNPHAAGLPALLTHNCIDAGLATWGSRLDVRATNCHRKTTTTDGWHKLAPGQ